MRYFTAIIFFMQICFVSHGQNIIDFLFMVPDSSVGNFSCESRREAAEDYLVGLDYFEARDTMIARHKEFGVANLNKKMHFLTFLCPIEGWIDLCYWDLKNGDKMVAVYVISGGPVCEVSSFDFFLYTDSTLTAIDTKKVLPDVYPMFFTGDIDEQSSLMEYAGCIPTMEFDLPKKGRNILVRWGTEGSQECFRPYGKGDRMVLKWNNGSFVAQKPYWDRETARLERRYKRINKRNESGN